MIATTTPPTRNGLQPRRSLRGIRSSGAWLRFRRRRGIYLLVLAFVLSVFVPWLPGTLPMTVWPCTHGSLPASHSSVRPPPGVFGYGFECRKFGPGPLAGALAGPPSLLGPFGAATTMKRCHVPLLSPSLSRLETLRNHSEM